MAAFPDHNSSYYYNTAQSKTKEKIYEYYIDSDLLDKIQNTKKYKKWIEKIEKEIEAWIEEVNEACKYIMDREYHCPYDLENEEDREYLDNYFCQEEFETTEVIENE